MSFQRKMVVFLGVILMSSLVFAGGGKEDNGSSSNTKNAPITLRLWGGVQPEYGYSELEENFNREFADRGIQLEYVRYVNDANGNLQLDTYLASGGEVDIFINYGGNDRLIPRVQSNLVLDITDLLKEKKFDYVEELGANIVNSHMVNNRVYTLPTQWENYCYWFANVNRFKEAGIPLPVNGWTYEEFRNVCSKLTSGEGINKKYGMYWGIRLNNTNYVRAIVHSILGNYGTYKDDAKTETNFDNPVWEQTIQLVADTMLNSKTALSLADEATDAMTFANSYLSGKAGIAVGFSQLRLVKDIKNYPHDFETAIIPAPVPSKEYMNLADHRQRPFLGGSGDQICISSKTKYPNECVDAIIWYIRGGMLPLARWGRVPAYQGISKQSIADMLSDGTQGIFNIPSLIKYLSLDPKQFILEAQGPAQAQISNVIKEEIEAALYGKKTVQQALKDAKSRSDLLIKNAAK
jgi:multiple sugar transport system substrate-binding protein